MGQEKIQEILKHQEEFLSTIDKALDEKLLETSWQVDSLKDKILGGLRWGLFLRPKVEERPELRTTTKLAKDSFHDSSALVRINFQEIEALQKCFADWGVKDFPIFSPKIDKEMLTGEIEVDFSYESLDADVSHTKQADQGVVPVNFLDFYELRLTLPDVFEAFGMDEDGSIPKWMEDSFDVYENWKWEVEARRRDYYVQIGGHGAWIQGSYTDTYIAQVNNDVGDAGAVFITAQPEKEFLAWVDMG